MVLLLPLSQDYYPMIAITRSVRQENHKCSKCGRIWNMNITTEILPGFHLLVPLCPLSRQYSPVITINQIAFFKSLWVLTLNYGGGGVILFLSFLLFLEKIDCTHQKKSEFNNPGIFHDFAVALFVGHYGQCGNLWSFNSLVIEWCKWHWK